MWSVFEHLSTRIYYGAFPNFALTDLPSALFELASMMWMELVISVLATVGYALYCAKQAPPTPKEKQEGSLDTTANPAPRPIHIKLSCLLLCIAAVIMLGAVAPIAQQPAKVVQTPPKVTHEDNAVVILQRQLQQAATPAAKHGIAVALVATLQARGKLAQAAEMAELAAKEAVSGFLRHEALLLIASLRRRLGDLQAAGEAAEEALRAVDGSTPAATDFDSLETRRTAREAKALTQAELATIRREEGKLFEANGLYRLAKSSKVDVTVGWAALRVLKGDTAEAQKELSSAVAKLKDGSERAEALLWIGRAHRDAGNIPSALESAQAAEKTAHAAAAIELEVAALLDVAAAQLESGSFVNAQDAIAAAEALLPSESDSLTYLRADACSMLAALLLRRGQVEEAEQQARKAVTLHQESGRSLKAAAAMTLLGRILLVRQSEDAVEILEEARRGTSMAMGFFSGVSAHTKWHLAAAYEAGGEKVRVQILRRSALEEAISPPTGTKDLTGEEAVRRAATVLLGPASLADGKHDASIQLCPVLKDSLSTLAQGPALITRVKAAMEALGGCSSAAYEGQPSGPA